MERIATIEFINNKNQNRKGLASLLAYCAKDAKTTIDGRKLVTGVNCIAKCAYTEFMNTKMQYGKVDGRMFYHLVQSFSPKEKVTPELAHKIALELTDALKGYEILAATHIDRDHIHSHFVINSVNADTGYKYHPNKNEIQRLRLASDNLCLKYGLSIITNPSKSPVKKMSSREYRAASKLQSWKVALAIAIDDAMKYAGNKNDFISQMKRKGYEVRWTDDRKYITYTCPNEMKCRDIKLHDEKYLKGSMENEFRKRKEIIQRYEGYDEEGTDTSDLCNDNRGKLGKSYQYPNAANRDYESSVGEAAFTDNIGADSDSYERTERNYQQQSSTDGEGNGNIQTEYVSDSNSVQFGNNGEFDINDETGWELERKLFEQFILGTREHDELSVQTENNKLDTDSNSHLINSSIHFMGNLATLIDNKTHSRRKRIKLSQKEIEKRLAQGQKSEGYEEYEDYYNSELTM